MKEKNTGHVVGFSLIELLVVIAILAILMVLTFPSITSVRQAGLLARGGQLLGDQIILARQEAQARNRDIEVRLVDLNDPAEPGFRAVQLWMVDTAGTSKSPASRVIKFPDRVVIASNGLSPMLDADSAVSGSTNFPGLGLKAYKGFRIRANGAPSSQITTSNNFLTLQLANHIGTPPDNYYAIRLDPISGRVTVHRP